MIFRFQLLVQSPEYCLTSFWSYANDCDWFANFLFDSANIALGVRRQIVKIVYSGYLFIPSGDCFVNGTPL